MQGYIYLIENKINGHKYVGMTQFSLERRWKEHLRDCTQKKTETRPLHMAIRKYGAENFSMSLIEECPIEILSEREKFWIQQYDTYANGYNATLGGDGKSFYNGEDIVKAYLTCYNITTTAKIIGCSSDTVSIYLDLMAVDRDLELEHSFRSGNPIIAKQNQMVVKIFPSQLKAAEWIQQQGKTIVTDLRKVSYIIGRAARGLDNRTQAYGYQWIKISPEDYVAQVK